MYAAAMGVAIGVTLLMIPLLPSRPPFTAFTFMRAVAAAWLLVTISLGGWYIALKRLRSYRLFITLLFASFGLTGPIAPWLAFGTAGGQRAPSFLQLAIGTAVMGVVGYFIGWWRDPARSVRAARERDEDGHATR
jgi:hypothetical protein